MTSRKPLDANADRLPDGFGAEALASLRTPAGLYSRDFRILWMNNAMGLVNRCKPRDAIGRRCHEVYKNCLMPCEECCMTEVVETGRTVITETWVDLPRERRWGDLHAYPVRSSDHEVQTVFVLAFDTTHHVLSREKAQADPQHAVPLSPRETEVLRFMAEGFTNTQISEKLTISAHTVKTHVNSVFNKLGVSDRTLAAVTAVRHNLI